MQYHGAFPNADAENAITIPKIIEDLTNKLHAAWNVFVQSFNIL